MSKNILMVVNDTKLKLELDNILIKSGEKEGVHPIKDLECILIDNMSTSITVRLLAKLSEFNVPLIITNNKHLPCGYYFPTVNHCRASKVINKQIEYKKNNDILWKEIVKNKIKNQAEVIKILFEDEKIYDDLMTLCDNVVENDISNREGHAAKIYFNRLMNSTFSRGNEDIILNSALDYAYAIIRSNIAKYLISYGLNLQLGIHHKNEYNDCNLADDLIEPFRPFVDLYCYKLMKDVNVFTLKYKSNILKIINSKVIYKEKNMEFINVINQFIMQVASLITDGKGINEIIFPNVKNMDCAKDEFEFEEIYEDYETMLFGEDDEV